MPETLKALYYGNISPFEAPIPAGSTIRKLASKLAKHEDALAELLDEDGKQLLWEFDDLHQRSPASTRRKTSSKAFAWACGSWRSA